MKCYFRFPYDGSEWIKGTVESTNGNLMTNFTMCDGDIRKTLCELINSDIQFRNHIMITGFRYIGRSMGDTQSYDLVSMEVSPGWRKPE